MFNLAWNDFEQCVSNSYREMLDSEHFVDVTLATDDDQHIRCHKVVISASSPVLRAILEKHPHQHPLIYLSGVKYQELRSIINFMYIGHTDVAQDVLETFMGVAAKFKIKGLSNCQINEQQKQEDQPTKQESEHPKQDQVKLEFKPVHEKDQSYENYESEKYSYSEAKQDSDQGQQMVDEEKGVELFEDENVDTDHISSNSPPSKVIKIGKEYKCGFCDYKGRFRNNVDMHRAAQHEGKRFPCDFCDYESKYQQDLIKHKGRKHLFNKFTSKRALQKRISE